MGGSLIIRSKQGCTLTPFGKKVVNESQIIMKYIDDWKTYSANSSVLEEIHITCFSNASRTVLSDLLFDFNCHSPHLDIILHSESAQASISNLRNHRCQLGLIMADESDKEKIEKELSPSEWKISEVFEDDFRIFVNKNSPILELETVSLKELSKFNFATFSELEMLYNPRFAIRKKGMVSGKNIFLDHYNHIFQFLIKDPMSFGILTNIFTLQNPYIDSGEVVTIISPEIDWHVKHYLVEPIESICDCSCTAICTAIKNWYQHISLK